MKHSKERIGVPEDGSEAVSVWICAELGYNQMVASQRRDDTAQNVHSALIWPLFSGHRPLIGIGWELHACFFAPFPLNLRDRTFVNCIGRDEVVFLVHEEQGYHVSKMIWCLHLFQWLRAEGLCQTLLLSRALGALFFFIFSFVLDSSVLCQVFIVLTTPPHLRLR